MTVLDEEFPELAEVPPLAAQAAAASDAAIFQPVRAVVAFTRAELIERFWRWFDRHQDDVVTSVTVGEHHGALKLSDLRFVFERIIGPQPR